MPTYRVSIRRPLTNPPIWDWAQTVVAKTPQIAIQDGYDNWVASKPDPAPPALEKCTSQAILSKMNVANATLLTDSGMSDCQQAFIDSLEKQVNDKLSSMLDGTFKTVSYPAGFNYGVTYGSNAYYNAATLHDVDTLLGAGSNSQLVLTGGGFSTYYAALLPNIAFVFSKDDQNTMNAQDAAATGQIASVLTAFTNAGGTYSSPLPFGGKLQDVFNQLTKQFGSLDNIPDTMNELRNAIASYKSIAATSYALHSKWYLATARLNAALANVTTPSASNGGMQTDNTSYYVGYTPAKFPTANSLIGGLSTTSNAVSVEFNVSNLSSAQSHLSISGGGGFDIPIADIIGLSISANASYDLSKYKQSTTNIDVKITYPGLTIFSAMPSNLSTDNSTGWYALDILQEVVANAGKDATGFQLQGSEYDVSQVFGEKGIFSRLKTFVISQQPTIQMTFSGSDTSQIVKDLQVNATAQIDLLGMFTIGSASANYSVHDVDDKSVSGAVVITFGPPNPSGTIPLQQQVAYVLGGVASYPPNNV